MNIVKLIGAGVDRLLTPIYALWHSVVQQAQQRRRQRGADASEVERLDRIRNPSKYLGKS